MVPEIGRVKKPVGSPSKSSSDRRVLASMMLPRTKASTKGPGSKPAFFIRYPTMPKAIIMKMSKVELLIV